MSAEPRNAPANTPAETPAATPLILPGLAAHREAVNHRDHIIVRGARTHNLRGLDLELPKRSLIVFTGPSGSGKSSLAFDTIYTEGRRRYVESLSTYARQFIGQMERPDVEQLLGLSPTISIEQKTTSNNPRSTVGTVTEIYDHLRVLYAKLGTPRCPDCDVPVTSRTLDSIMDELMTLPARTKFMVLAPLVRNRKGEFRDLFAKLRGQGFVRARIDGKVRELDEVERLRKTYKHNIDVVVDRLIMKANARERITGSVQQALELGQGSCIIWMPERGDELGDELLFSLHRTCVSCGTTLGELTHQSFSFNSPLGMCTCCKGIGALPQASPMQLVPDESLSVLDGAIAAIGPSPTGPLAERHKYLDESMLIWNALLGAQGKLTQGLDVPWAELLPADRNYILYGSTRGRRKRPVNYKGVAHEVERWHQKGKRAAVRNFFGEFIAPETCPECEGARLNPASRAVQFRERSIERVCQDSVATTRAFFEEVTFREGSDEERIGGELVREITERLCFLENVGLHYLSLNRAAGSLSGGEAQRIRLASQLGSELSGILYVLDEPSIGLHQRDNQRLINTLGELRDRGNTVLVVEHDRDTMERADMVVDFGPGAGRLGGEIVAKGSVQDIQQTPGSLTGAYLSGAKQIAVPETRRTGTGRALVVHGAAAHNLREIDVHIPQGTFTCLTGVSGAGKSTLIHEIIYPALARHLYTKHRGVGAHTSIEGLDLFDKVIEIDQQPIGRTPRSNPATYTKVFDHIRALFAGMPEAKMYGFGKSRFSFNVAGGRCEECKGDGMKKVEMSFLADVYVPCEVCLGKRFNAATLRVGYHGHNIADVLDMTIEEAAVLFDAHPKIRRVMQTFLDVGLDYIKLGQPSPTLSGGEAQRVKLARELAKVATGDTLYILDEPSTGLHFEDIRKLLLVIDRLVDAGNTVVTIEHNMDIIKYADHIIDLGPEGGDAGGSIVAQGTPEEVAACAASHTGRFLREELAR